MWFLKLERKMFTLYSINGQSSKIEWLVVQRPGCSSSEEAISCRPSYQRRNRPTRQHHSTSPTRLYRQCRCVFICHASNNILRMHKYILITLVEKNVEWEWKLKATVCNLWNRTWLVWQARSPRCQLSKITQRAGAERHLFGLKSWDFVISCSKSSKSLKHFYVWEPENIKP